MLGPTTVLLMLLPVALGILVAVTIARRTPGDGRVCGAWLILVALPVAAVCDHVRGQVAEPSTVNRTEAVALCVVAGVFVYLNRRRARVVAVSAWLVGIGVWLNALGVLVFGAMPVLQRAAATADKPFTGSHPSPGYVRSEGLGWFGVAIGDVIPIPHFLKVLSIGDLFLFAGCIALLGVFLARLWWSENPDIASPELTTGWR